ncbi:TetR/AcrR family transcriptional regulator [Phreatobacter sp.]|uniref:TetR/AcrR family transcriptional regulator n=1 Tax=Phreatobacter sp. TaxID=1966341 RepID=UPI003F729AB9
MRRTLPDSRLAERRGYHHGNLRESLVEAARRLIAERGPAGFTLSDAAKLAGVSPAAPYRHFKDRQALLREVAQLGFQELGRRLGQSTRSAGPGPDGFMAMGRAYLDFAREEPAYYAAMFNTGLAGSDEAEGTAEKEADPGFALLEQAVGQFTGVSDPAQRRQGALIVYALTHGLASLAAPGSVAVPGTLGDAAEVLNIGVTALLRGLPSALADPSLRPPGGPSV